MNRKLIFTSVFLSLGTIGFAQEDSSTQETQKPLTLWMPAIFSDHMVLQAGKDISLWGKAKPAEKVSAHFLEGATHAPVTADKDGKWKINIGKYKTGQAGVLVVTSGDNKLTLKDVIVGEVWVGSGQSNMEMLVETANDAKKEIADANYPKIRMFTIKRNWNIYPQEDVVGEWKVCTPENVGEFSATAYYFGRMIHKKQKTPVGLIATSWGGATVESWVPAAFMKNHKKAPYLVQRYNQNVAYHEASKAEQKKIVAELGKIKAPRLLVIKYQDDKAYKAGIHKPDYDDKKWMPMRLPGFWEKNIPSMDWFDGVVWLRQTENIPASWAGKDAVLICGPVDDFGDFFINGEHISPSKKTRTALELAVPGELIRSGKNHFALRIQDSWGWGGMNGDTFKLQLKEDPKQVIDLAGDWKYKITHTPKSADILDTIHPQYYGKTGASSLYNAMLAPIVPYPIAGAIWYQGEANIRGAREHHVYLEMLIRNWRIQWGQGEFPFLFVQLANYRKRDNRTQTNFWADLRDAQRKTLSVPNTAMAVAIDIGDAEDIHPKNKQEVGRRLALGALNLAYGNKIPYRGPMIKSHTISNDKKTVNVTFEYVGKEIVAKGSMDKSFAILSDDQRWHWASAAKISGKNTVLVTAPKNMNIHEVRYAWQSNPLAPLYNSHNLPAVPFNTRKMRLEK